VVECNESVRVKAADIVDWGFTQANTIPPLKSQIYKLDKELKRAKAEISELNGVVESNSAEIEGLKEDLAVNIAGYDAEKAEKEERIKERDEANEQLEFLEGELEGVRAEETRLRSEVKSQGEELRDVTKNRDDLDDEVRRLKDLSNAREVEASKLRAQQTSGSNTPWRSPTFRGTWPRRTGRGSAWAPRPRKRPPPSRRRRSFASGRSGPRRRR